MSTINQIVLDFYEQLHASVDIDAMFLAIEQATTALGFDNLSYTFVPGAISHSPNQLQPIFKISKAYNAGFIRHYVDAEFGQQDFTIKRIINGDFSPMVWWREAKNQSITRAELEVIEVARQEYGICHGISIPTYSDGYNIAGVSVTREYRDHQFDELCSERGEHLRRLSQMFSDRVLCRHDIRAVFMAPFLQKLTTTEKQVLSKLAKGCNLKAVCHELQLDYKYVANSVIKSLRKKFGNVTRDALMYEAGMLNFSQLLNET
ncbi:MAG TPA: autoinducer binding domain-containing protein [Marinagarivorans sp.]